MPPPGPGEVQPEAVMWCVECSTPLAPSGMSPRCPDCAARFQADALNRFKRNHPAADDTEPVPLTATGLAEAATCLAEAWDDADRANDTIKEMKLAGLL